MGKQLFGTDGIRGVAGEYPLDPRTAFAFGMALGDWASRRSSQPSVLIGMDTRESGSWLSEVVAGGLRRRGAQVRFAGVITTPGAAWLTRTGDFLAGVMISASHNPYQDNGLKVFDHSGYKLPDDQEHTLENEILALVAAGVEPEKLQVACDPDLDERYLKYLLSTTESRLDGLRIVVDSANGAAYRLGPRLLEELGATVESTGSEPNGRNINLHCGALHVEALRELVLARGAHAGVAFDGDADRCIMVSPSGRIIDGDHVLLLAARHMHATGRLRGSDGEPIVVATVMSNLGLEKALQADGIRMLRTAVGDKYVIEEMIRRGAALGGEQSGHVIFRDFATTGDGMLTALRVLEICALTGSDLDQLTSALTIYPQLLVNVRVKERKPLESLPEVQAEIRRAEASFAGAGRILVRFSGTEPLARVMVEGDDRKKVEQFANSIAGAIRAELGSVS